jgi:hypothetical protein
VATLGAVSTFTDANAVETHGTMASLVTTFYKTKDVVDLTLTARTMNNSAFSATFEPLAGLYTFTIVGVKE